MGPLGDFSRMNAYEVPSRTTADRPYRAVGNRSCRIIPNMLEEATDIVEVLEDSSSYENPVGHPKAAHPWQQAVRT
jgi:hypothetical protein